MVSASLQNDLHCVMSEAINHFGHQIPALQEQKAHQDYVTDLDLAVDAWFQDALLALHPNLPVLSEERALETEGLVREYWMIDPIDGTHNLVAGLPFVGISVALIDANGPRLAAVASLADGTIWMAERGKGAWKVRPGQSPVSLKFSDKPPIDLVVLSTGLIDALLNANADGISVRWAQIREIGKIRNLGAQALHLCGVASGQFAAACSIEARIWDEAAAGLIVREAGGVWASEADKADWKDPAGLMAIRQQRSLACHPAVAATLSRALKGFVTSATA